MPAHPSPPPPPCHPPLVMILSAICANTCAVPSVDLLALLTLPLAPTDMLPAAAHSRRGARALGAQKIRCPHLMQAMLASRPRMVLHEAAYKSPPQVNGARERRIETATTAQYVEPSAEPMGAGGDRQHVACPTDADGGNAAKTWHSLTGSSSLSTSRANRPPMRRD